MRKLQWPCVLALVLFTFSLIAQNQPLEQRDVEFRLDSGVVRNQIETRGVIYSEVVSVPEASWIRLRFSDVQLPPTPKDGLPAILRITSLKDEAVQTLNTVHVRQWRNTSAYFNGDTVILEIIADPGTGAARISMNTVWAGPAVPQQLPNRSICGPTDDRQLSNEARDGRIVPIGCSGWIIDDQNKCFLTAGHCQGGMDVVEFNVPLSDASGAIVHPGPEDQYPVDPASVQGNGGQGPGNDWAYFGTFPNATTGLTPFEAQGDNYTLGPPPAVTGNIRITGYGTTSFPVPNEWNQVQKTHVGPFLLVSGDLLRYSTDTTGGNSGSAVLHEETGIAIGIHTHAGCDSGGNQGTNILHAGLQNALANPTGVCAPPPPLAFNLPEGIPYNIQSEGIIRVEVSGINGGTPQTGSGMLHYDIGSGMVAVAMTEVSPNVYDAVFPVMDCGTRVSFYFSAQSTEAETVTEPNDAPGHTYTAEVFDELDAAFADNFSTDMGWTVENDVALTDGAWERGVPMGGGIRNDPNYDVSGHGACFLTDNVIGNSDVDGGHTVLTSPLIDASEGDPHLSYWLWHSTDETDVLVVEISGDDGATWTQVQSVGNQGDQWVFHTFRIADIIAPTNQMRVRFDSSDLGDGSVVESGLDDFRIHAQDPFVCGPAPCFGDINGDLTVDETDLDLAIGLWNLPGGDVNNSGFGDIIDLIQIMDAFGLCE